MGEERQGCALPMLFLQARHLLWAGGIVPEKQHGGFGEGPCAIRLADFRAGGSVSFPRRFLRALAEAAIGHNILDPGEAHTIRHLIQEDPRQDCANPGDRGPPVQCLGIVVLRRVDEGSLQGVADLVVVTNEGEVSRNALWHGGIGTPFGDASPVCLLGQLLPNLGQIVLAGGMLDRREHRGPCACAMHAAPQQVAGRPHRGGRDVGVWEQATAEQHGDFLRVNPVIFGRAALDGLHRQRVSEDKRQAFAGPQIGQPVPGEHTVDTDDPILPVRRDGLAKGFGAG